MRAYFATPVVFLVLAVAALFLASPGALGGP